MTFPSFDSLAEGTRNPIELHTIMRSVMAGVKIEDKIIAFTYHLDRLLGEMYSRSLDWYQVIIPLSRILEQLNKGMDDSCFSIEDDRFHNSIKNSVNYMLDQIIREEGGGY